MTEAELQAFVDSVIEKLEADGEDGAAQYMRALARIGGPATALRLALTDAQREVSE